jgi:imidazoleglycerol phosphate synthase glutamine amidotransferase subunit HisH
MTLKSRLQKLTNKLKPEEVKIYYMGWQDCAWSESEGLFRQVGESKEDFFSRVYKTTKKQFLWFS